MATVDDYIEALPEPLRETAERAREVIAGELGDGVIWHGHPVWMIGTTPVALLKAYTTFVTFGLFQGQLLEDPSGRLEPAARHEAHFAGWLREAGARVASPAA